MNKIIDLIEDALSGEDYRLEINLIVASLVSAESNDTKRKMQTNNQHLNEIYNYIGNLDCNEEVRKYLCDMRNRIKMYLTESIFSENPIENARISAGLSRVEMSRIFEIPVRTLEDWESGKREPAPWAEKLIVEKLESMRI